MYVLGGRFVAAIVTAVVAMGLLVSCTPPAVESVTPGSLDVTVAGGVQPTVEVAALPEAAAAEITGLGQATEFVMGTPMSIELDGELPSGGATLTRTYAQPLPEDVVATFAYWDKDFETWQAVPTSISKDRLTVTADVDHFSIWTDFISGSQQALTTIRDNAAKAGQAVAEWTTGAVNTASEALHWSLGNIFTKRVDLPECELPTPTWVIDLPVGVGVDDPVRFCAGYDKANPDLLVVKARANRGYGFPAVLNVPSAWEYNSTSENSIGKLLEQVGSLDQAVADATYQLLNSGRFVGAGEEISFGIPASALADFKGEYLLEMRLPSVSQVLMSTIAQQLVAWGASKVNGTLAAALAVANCGSSLAGVTDIGSGAGAVLGCLQSADEKIAQMIGLALLANGMQENAAGKLAGQLVGKISVALALLPAAINTIDYIAEMALPQNARSLTISAAEVTAPDPDEPWLITAEGVGPIRLAHIEEDFALVRERRYLCSGADVAWAVAGGADGNIGGGERGPWIQISAASEVSGDVPAPRTESGITIGTTLSELKAAGFYSNVDSEFWWSSVDGVVLTAYVANTSGGAEPQVTSLVLGSESLGAYDCG
ncbi:hypothetical protein [Microbacterium sp. CH-015]|uniref:hypothetical protein n=1 Tax=Microbacterium sp. CH-015 TaxID=3406734 RepID=UPI003C782185